jgi:DNA replication protein DnaC
MSTKSQSEIPKFFETVDKNGQITVQLNPAWQKHIQNIRYDYYLKESGIPIDYWDIDFDSFPWEKSKESVSKCIKFSKEMTEEKFSHISLFLYGTNSSGKTSVQCAIGKAAIRHGLKVSFVLAGILTDLFFKVKGFKVEDEAKATLDKIQNSNLILIDDAFDKNKSTLWSGENRGIIIGYWDSFLRDMISRGTRFVITSNFSIAEVGTSYGVSIKELLERNFVQLYFQDQVKFIRKNRLERVFEER